MWVKVRGPWPAEADGAFICAAIAPTKPPTIYLGSAWDVGGYGIWVSTDSGKSWMQADEGIPRLLTSKQGRAAVFDIQIDPSNSSTVYAATQAGVFRTRDNGRHWERRNGRWGWRGGTALPAGPTADRTVYCLAIDPRNPATLYAGTTDGVYKSTDAGNAWKPANKGMRLDAAHPYTITSIVIDPRTSNTLYASGYGPIVAQFPAPGATPGSAASKISINTTLPTGLYKSTDGGATWQTVRGGLGFALKQVAAIAVYPDDSSTLYVGTNPQAPYEVLLDKGGVLKSTDGGQTWAGARNGLPRDRLGYYPYITTLLFAGPTGGWLYATGIGAGGVWLSKDRGATWQGFGKGLPTQQAFVPYALCFRNTAEFFLTSHLGVYRLVTQTEEAPAYKGKMLFVRRGDVFLADLDTGQTRRLIQNARLPVWTPDNKAVLFTRMVSRKWEPHLNMRVEDWSLLRFDIRSGKSTEISSKVSCYPVEAAESAVDGRIAFTSDGVNGNGHVFFSTGSRGQIPPAFPGIQGANWQWGPSISDDGRRLAYFTRSGVVICGMPDLRVIASSPMTYSGSCRTAWSPTGDWLVAPDGDGRLFRLDLRGARRALLAGLGRNCSLHPSVSPNGDAVAFEQDGAICVCPAEGGTPRLLLQDASEPCWQHSAVRITDRFLDARRKASLFVEAARRGDWATARALLDPDPSTSSISEIKKYRSALAKLPPSSEWAAEVSPNDERNIVFIIHVGKDTYILVVSPGGINKFYPASDI